MTVPTRIVVGSLRGCAAILLLAAAGVLLAPALYRTGVARTVGSQSEDRISLRFFRSMHAVRVREGMELSYAVRLSDRSGTYIATVAWQRPAQEGGEGVKYLPFWPRINVPVADYTVGSHLAVAGVVFLFGALAAYGARRCARESGVAD